MSATQPAPGHVSNGPDNPLQLASQKINSMIQNLKTADWTGMLRTYGFFYKYVQPFKFRFFMALLITFPLGMMDGMMAGAIKPFFDALAEGKTTLDFALFTAPITFIPIVIIVFNVVQGGLNYISYYLTSYVSNRISNNVRLAMFERLLEFDVEKAQTVNSSFVVSRFFYDPNQAQNALLQNTKTIISRTSSALSIGFVMFMLNWKLCFISLGVILTIIFPVAFVKKKINGLLDSESKIYAGVLAVLIETLNGMKVVHSFTLYQFLVKQYNAAQKAMYDQMMGISKAQAILQPINYSITSFGIALVLWYGSYLVMNGEITAGSLVAFVTSMLMLYRPMRMIGNTVITTQQLLKALNRVIEIMTDDSYQARPTGHLPDVPPLHNAIEFKNVSFKYASRTDLALDNVTVTIPKGQMVALVGRSGSGKTTLADLVQGFYEIRPDEEEHGGDILYDGASLYGYNMKSIRRQMGYVSQDTFLFEGTIALNVSVGCEQATQKDIEVAIERAYLKDFIDSLPDGLETHIGERGIRLSGGQRQRIAIARAFLKNAPVLVLDEATSALDSESEQAVQKALDDLMANRTTLVIAHRLSTIRNADKIVVMDKGHVIEEGDHDTLLSQQGLYYHLYNTQFQQDDYVPAKTTTEAEALTTV